jgi:protein-disulfide isomerase
MRDLDILFPMDQEKFSSLESLHHTQEGGEHPVAQEAVVAAIKKDHFLPISILIAAVVIGGSILFATLYHGGSPSPAGGGANNPPVPTTTVDVGKLGPRDVILGNANAPVTLIEYADYQCPFCGMFFSQIEPTLKKNYIDTGKVKMVFRDFPFLGPESTAAGAAAACAQDQNKFWQYHDALYTAEGIDGHENNGNLDRALFIKLAGNVGLNVNDFTACLDGNKYAATVADDYKNGVAAGVNSTPTTFVNGKKVVDASGNSVGANAALILQAVDAAVKG